MPVPKENPQKRKARKRRSKQLDAYRRAHPANDQFIAFAFEMQTDVWRHATTLRIVPTILSRRHMTLPVRSSYDFGGRSAPTAANVSYGS
jgi:hypothetical protein